MTVTDPIDRLRAANPVSPDDAAHDLRPLAVTVPGRDVLERPRVRMSRRGPVLAGGLAVALAFVILAAGALIDGGSAGKRLDIVSEARAALAPGAGILHVKIDLDYVGSPELAPSSTEWWLASDPARWRLLPARAAAGVPSEYAYADGALRSYDRSQNQLQVTARRSDAVGAAGPGLLGPSASGNAAASLEAALASGKVTDTGERTVGGRTVRRLVTALTDDAGFSRFTYDVDPDTFVPVGGTMEFGADRQDVRPMIRFTVATYERLPATAANERLLAIQVPPGTIARPAPSHPHGR
ncbi:hypothetical protein DSM112329_02997 [Paraconexibacter sp. AEG42_29]|uniref:Uncharacterized protein n=1 Tax=Paraconexibacter sp. AEG42_29 TaxID=2997339 RepID=A0AAU7AXV2_9ACTN